MVGSGTGLTAQQDTHAAAGATHFFITIRWHRVLHCRSRWYVLVEAVSLLPCLLRAQLVCRAMALDSDARVNLKVLLTQGNVITGRAHGAFTPVKGAPSGEVFQLSQAERLAVREEDAAC